MTRVLIPRIDPATGKVDTGQLPDPPAQQVFAQHTRPTAVPAGSLWIELDNNGDPTGHQEVYT